VDAEKPREVELGKCRLDRPGSHLAREKRRRVSCRSAREMRLEAAVVGIFLLCAATRGAKKEKILDARPSH
jgi:hypothetical protein